MIGVNIKWHGEAFKKKMEQSMLDKLTRIGIHLKNKTKKNINSPTWSSRPSGRRSKAVAPTASRSGRVKHKKKRK